MARIYWIGTGLGVRNPMRRKKIHLGLDERQEDNSADEEVRFYDDEDYRLHTQATSDKVLTPEFEEVHEWLWPDEPRHKEYASTEAGMKRFLNALTYTAGDKSVLAYSRLDVADSPAFYGTPGAVLVWLTEVARLGASVYFVKDCIKRRWSGEFDDEEDEAEKLRLLSELPSPDDVKEYDKVFGRRSVSRRRR